jgi:hypothetical protein
MEIPFEPLKYRQVASRNTKEEILERKKPQIH